MTESASVKCPAPRYEYSRLCQITRFMYRQLGDVSLERFEAFGRAKDNKLKSGEGVLQLMGRDTKTEALVRYDAQPPPAEWPTRAAPSEFSHWLVHTQEYVDYSYPVAEGPDGRSMVWTVNSNIDCPNEFGWHISQKRPPRGPDLVEKGCATWRVTRSSAVSMQLWWRIPLTQ